MAEARSEMSRAVRSLETTKRAKDYLPHFYNRAELRKQPGAIQAWCMQTISTEILTYFDLVEEWPENYGTLCAARLVSTGFCEEAEAEGYANDVCSYVRNSLGYLRRCRDLGHVPPEAPGGGIGEPRMLLGGGEMCDPRYKWFQAIGTHYLPLPSFNDDILSPVWDTDVDDPRIAEHYKAQFRASFKAQIAFLERQTGKRFDPERFREIMKNSQEAFKYWYGVLELRKAVPCPMGAEDYFSCMIPQLYMFGRAEAVNFYKALYEEVKGRVEKGVGVIPNEKYRLVWFGLPPWFNLGLYNWLESQGAIVCTESIYWTGPYVEVDLSDPLEALVERIWKMAVYRQRHSSEASPELCLPAPSNATLPTKLLLRWVDEYKLDGAVMHRTRSCRALTIGEIHARNHLEKLGVPTLIFESDMADPRAWSDSQIKAQFTGFLETLASARLRRRGG